LPGRSARSGRSAASRRRDSAGPGGIDRGAPRARAPQPSTPERAMKYLCLAYEEESVLDDLSPDGWDDLRRETVAYVDTLRANGHLLSTHALKSVRTAMTVRVRNDRLSTTDGPFAETKETLGGFFLIEAADLNE